MSDPVPSPAPSRWTRKRKIVAAAGGAVLALVLVAWWLGQPIALEPVPAAVEANDALYEMLALGGVHEAVADVTQERVLVRYNVPENATDDERAWTFWYIVAAAHEVAPGSETLVVQVYEAFEPAEESVVAMEDVAAFIEGRIDEKTMLERTTRTDWRG